MKGRNRELWDKAEEERRRCRDWLLGAHSDQIESANPLYS